MKEKLDALWAPVLSDAQKGEGDVEELFLRGLYRNRCLTITYAKERAKRRRWEEYEFEEDPQSTIFQTKLIEAEVALHAFQKQKIEWMMSVAQENWLKESGRCPRYICLDFKQQAV